MNISVGERGCGEWSGIGLGEGAERGRSNWTGIGLGDEGKGEAGSSGSSSGG